MNISDSAHPTGPSPRPSAATLEFREATKRYPGQTEPAVERLSLTVPSGEICVLVGPSGCGKTTAMRMVNRMIDNTDGDILLDGQSVRERRPAELRRDIGYAIQQIGLFPHLTVAENIATVPKLKGWESGRITIDGEDVMALPAVELRRRIGYVIQQVGLFPHLTVAENVAVVPRLLRWPAATPPSSRAASASASASPARWPLTRRCC